MPTAVSPQREAIASPLALVDRLFAASPSSPEDVETSVLERFRSIFGENAAIAAIPSLTDPQNIPATKLNPHTLVRFRCMTQDTSFGSELYLPSVPSRDGTKLCSMFREPRAAAVDDQDVLAGMGGGQTLAEREVVFAVSIPGESAWVVHSLDKELVSEDDVDDSPISRLSLSEDDDAAQSDVPASERRRTDLRDLAATKDKLPASAQVGAVLKFYGLKGEGVKVADALEVVGVLDWTSFDPAATEMADDAMGKEDSGDDVGTEVVPCVHVLFHRPAPSPTSSSDIEGVEAALLDLKTYVAEQAFGGDEVAAEYLLLAMAAKIHSRVGGMALGALPLNLILPAFFQSDLPALFASLLPRTTSSPLTLPLLNSKPFNPTSTASTGVSTGLLQLPPSSLLHLDARLMGEGALSQTGLKNVRGIEKLANEGKVGYVFPFDVFEMDCDAGVVVSSEGGKTFLSGFLPLFVKPSQSTPTPAAASDAQLAAFRALLATAREAEPAVPASLTETVQSLFVSARRGAKTADEAELRMGKDDLARIVEVARGLAKLKGLKEVGPEEVRRAGKLEGLRREREQEAVQKRSSLT